MTTVFKPKMILPKGKKVAIIVSKFNDFITQKLLEGAQGKLEEFGMDSKSILVYWVPGSLEIPVVAGQVIKKKKPDAVIAIGAIIRGETDHYNVVLSESNKGIAQLSLSTGIPIINSILTCDNVDQAIDRAGVKVGNKGADAATATVEMLSLIEQANLA